MGSSGQVRVDRPVPTRQSVADVALEKRVAHGGVGEIGFARLVSGDRSDALHFIDVAVLPPGVSIGLHTHGPDEEEYYLVLAGTGSMTVDGETFRAAAGDLIRNRPGGTHTFVNDSDADVHLFVFEVSA